MSLCTLYSPLQPFEVYFGAMIFRARNNSATILKPTASIPYPNHGVRGRQRLDVLIVKGYRTISISHQNKLHQASASSTVCNIALSSMINEKCASDVIFKHIVDSVGAGLHPGLVESYLFQILSTNNMNAVVSLAHILLHSDREHYKLSNQFWSLLASKAVSLGHHGAASLVYHEIVNPFINFVTGTHLSDENEHIPFLILPSIIEGLAVIFARSGNYIAVEGLRSYFKRFYSNYGHRDVYQTLYMSKVEALAEAKLFQEALNSFVSLSVKYRGYLKNQNPKVTSHSLKYASHINFKKRQQSISQNLTLGDSDKHWSNERNNQFFPIVKFNDYNIEGGSYWAIFDDVLEVEDLPVFQALLRERIGELALQNGSIVDQLWHFVSKNHIAIGRFVVACLCDLGFCREALTVVGKLASSTSNRNVSHISSGEFRRIFKSLEIRLRNCSCLREESEDVELIMETYTLCQRVYLNDSMPYACLQSFLESYFMTSSANIVEVSEIISAWRSGGRVRIPLNDNAYQKALSCGLAHSDLSDILVSHI